MTKSFLIQQMSKESEEFYAIAGAIEKMRKNNSKDLAVLIGVREESRTRYFHIKDLYDMENAMENAEKKGEGKYWGPRYDAWQEEKKAEKIAEYNDNSEETLENIRNSKPIPGVPFNPLEKSLNPSTGSGPVE